MVNFLPKIFAQERPSEDRFYPFNVAQEGSRTLFRTPASSIIHACIERIISRAINANFYTLPETGPFNLAARPNQYISPHKWYRQLYEQLLLTGNALVWMDEHQNFHVGITEGSTYDHQNMTWNIVIDINGNTIQTRHNEGMLHFYLGRHEGSIPHLVQSPADMARDALALHDETRGLLCDYAENGHRLAGTFMTTSEVTDDDHLKALSVDLARAGDFLNKRYSTMTTPPYIQFQPTGGAPPPSEGGIDLAIREIARIYGVPVELLQLGHYRSDFTNVDTHLLVEGVYPLLDSVVATWSEFLYPMGFISANYEPLSLLRVTLGSSAAVIMQLAGTGAFTINELRRFIGLKEFPSYNHMPQTSGAPGRGGEGGNGSKSSESGHPGGGSEETDDRHNEAVVNPGIWMAKRRKMLKDAGKKPGRIIAKRI